MKGRNSNTGYKYGGQPNMRSMHGVGTFPRNGTEDSVKKAAEGKTTGIVGDKGIGTDGVPVKSSLARAARKLFKRGGRVHRDEGGGVDKTNPNQGPGELANADQARYLRKKAENDPPGLGNPNALLTGAGVGTALHMLGKSRLPIPVRGLLGAAGIGAAYKGAKGVADDFGAHKEAAKARHELEQFDNEKKHGGKVHREEGGGVAGAGAASLGKATSKAAMDAMSRGAGDSDERRREMENRTRQQRAAGGGVHHHHEKHDHDHDHGHAHDHDHDHKHDHDHSHKHGHDHDHDHEHGHGHGHKEEHVHHHLHMKKGGPAKWMQGAVKHPGGLHRALHVPEGEKIPAKKLEKAEHSDNPHMRKMANLAETFKKFHK